MSIKYPKNHPYLIVVLGPTASGKTDFAIKLAKYYNGEIICADSRTIYQEMDIGTAKPTIKLPLDKLGALNPVDKKSDFLNGIGKNKKPIAIIQKVPHYLLNIKKPNENFSVAEFKQMAIKIIKDIQSRGKLPFLVGGTGLYISAVVNNLQIPSILPDNVLRKTLSFKLKKYGLNYLYKKLIKLDPEAKNFIDPHNPRRIIRALEVCLKTGQSFSELRKINKSPFKILQIGLKLPRPKLYQRINNRVAEMIKNGLINEVKKLNKKYSPRLPAMSSIGYRQINLYLKNKLMLEQAVDSIKTETRHYAKRQITWFKRDKSIKWLKPNNIHKANKLIKKFLD